MSPRVRVALAFATAIAISPAMPAMPPITGLGIEFLIMVFVQLITGIGLGFATSLFFQLFILTGQFVAMQMGLGFAMMVDPTNGISVTVLSQFFLILVTLTFLALNGHLVVLEVLIAGYSTFPMTLEVGVTEMAHQIVGFGGWMFSGALLIAFPAVVSLLIVNLSFGVMTRAAPQLNIFSLGFPFSVVFGMLIVWVMTLGWLPRFENLSRLFYEWAGLWGG